MWLFMALVFVRPRWRDDQCGLRTTHRLPQMLLWVTRAAWLILCCMVDGAGHDFTTSLGR